MILAAIIYFKRQFIAELFSEEKEVSSLIVDSMPIISFILIGLLFSLFGAIFACAWQEKIVPIAFISTYIVAFPLSLWLGYSFKLGVKGFWIGNLFGVWL